MNPKINIKSLLYLIAIAVGLSFVIAFYSNTIFQKVFSQKVWAHKTNSLIGLENAANTFVGIELDIVFNSDLNQFEVNHPPDPSVNLF